MARKYREIAVEAPESSIEAPYPVVEGMRAWKNIKNDFTVVVCHYTADPEKRSDEWYNKATAGLRDDQIEREYEINFESKAGTKVFPFLEHNEAIYRADPPSPIPYNWKIIASMDYGARNPTAVYWFAIDEYRRFWCFDEYYRPMSEVDGGLPEFARYILNHPYYSRAKFITCDPSMFNRSQNVLVAKEHGQKSYGTLMSIVELLGKEGIYKFQRANNDRAAGLERLRTMLNYRGPENSKPYLFIGKRCKKMYWELNNLMHKPDDDQNKNAEEDVIKRNDHAFDALKYALLSHDIPSEAVPDNRVGKVTLKSIEDEMEEDYNNKKRIDAFSCSFQELDGAFDETY